MNASSQAVPLDRSADNDLVERIGRGSEHAFRLLMSQNNQRLFRVARSFLSSDHEAEDAVQQAYVNAFERIASFRGEASLATWLARIVVNEAKQRLRNRKKMIEIDTVAPAKDGTQVVPFPLVDSNDPSINASRSELRRSLEMAIDSLPPTFRAVFVMREIEECSVEETAESLGILPATVKTRLHRARKLIRSSMEARAAASLRDAFHFQGLRCARITERVIETVKARGLELN